LNVFSDASIKSESNKSAEGMDHRLDGLYVFPGWGKASERISLSEESNFSFVSSWALTPETYSIQPIHQGPSFLMIAVNVVFMEARFSTKDRFPFLSDDGVRGEVHAFLGGIAQKLGSPPVLVGGISDHVHMLLQLGRSVSQVWD